MLTDPSFAEANKKVHLVETQWHYPIMTKYGFVPETKSAIGFVRQYVYAHPETGRKFECNTGVNSCYWREKQICPSSQKGGGLWSLLEEHLKKTTAVK